MTVTPFGFPRVAIKYTSEKIEIRPDLSIPFFGFDNQPCLPTKYVIDSTTMARDIHKLQQQYARHRLHYNDALHAMKR